MQNGEKYVRVFEYMNFPHSCDYILNHHSANRAQQLFLWQQFFKVAAIIIAIPSQKHYMSG